MPLPIFITLLVILYLLERSFIPGLLGTDTTLHISLLLLMTFLYQAWNEWIAGFTVFTLLISFTFTSVTWLLLVTYLGLLCISYILTQSILGTRSLSSYFIYTLLISGLLSSVHIMIFELPPSYFVGHVIFSTLFMLTVWFTIPLRPRTILSAV